MYRALAVKLLLTAVFFKGFCFTDLAVDAHLYMETLCDRLSEQENADFSVNMNGAGVVTVF